MQKIVRIRAMLGVGLEVNLEDSAFQREIVDIA
jgi:hypothetical protein